jgi:glutamate synthase (ferredoxin)
MVGLTVLSLVDDPAEEQLVRSMIERHVQWTQSAHARRILERWEEHLPRFVRVLPNDYRRVVDAQRRMREKGLSPDEAEMAAFEQNAHDEARVGGN